MNVPPDDLHSLYGKLENCAPRGAVSLRALQVTGDGTSVDVGVLTFEPGVKLTGRVVTSDGSELLPGTRILLAREDALDTLSGPLTADGRFTLAGLPRDLVTLDVPLRSYHVSPANESYDFVNHMGLLGRLEADAELEVVLDPGPEDHELALPDEEVWERYTKLRRMPLRGRVQR